MTPRFATPADDALLTSIAMHPEVRRWTACDGAPAFDPSAYTAHPRSKAILVEDGCFACPCLEDRAYAVHTQFLPDVRGSEKLRRGLEALAFGFLNSDAEYLVTMVPDCNPRALVFAHAMGFRDTYRRANAFRSGGIDHGMQHLSLQIDDWVLQYQQAAQVGRAFHDQLAQAGEPQHDEDPVHDAFAGAACLLIAAGQPDKATRIYGRWARAAGYQPFTVVDEGLAFGDRVLHIQGNQFTFKEHANA